MWNERFEWHDDKAAINRKKHGVSFELAAEVFDDPHSVTVGDIDHSWNEQRFRTIGATISGMILVVVHSEPEARIRLLSARVATRRERERYMDKPPYLLRDAVLDDFEEDDGMLPEYDFSNGVRGKYWNGKPRPVLRKIDADLATAFPTDESVNDTLREVLARRAVK